MNVGEYRHRVTVQDPTRTKTTGGGFTQTWADITNPKWWCAIESATAARMERLAGAGAIAAASHVLHGRYHEGISTRSRLVLDARVFAVRGVVNVNEANEVTRVFAEEIVA